MTRGYYTNPQAIKSESGEAQSEWTHLQNTPVHKIRPGEHNPRGGTERSSESESEGICSMALSPSNIRRNTHKT